MNERATARLRSFLFLKTFDSIQEKNWKISQMLWQECIVKTGIEELECMTAHSIVRPERAI